MNRALLEKGLAAIASRLAPSAPPPAAGAGDAAASWRLLADDLLRYLGELQLWNPKLGLVEATGDELITKHLLDCLAPLPLLLPLLDRGAAGHEADEPLRLADIGSGAGLPGVVLCLALRRLWPGRFTMTLVEKQQRRVGFLLNAKALLALDNLELQQESIERVGEREAARFDLVTARAFKPLEPLILASLRRLLRPSGCLFLYKGKRERIDAELAEAGLGSTAEAWSGTHAAVLPVSVPFLAEERHVVIVGSGAG